MARPEFNVHPKVGHLVYAFVAFGPLALSTGLPAPPAAMGKPFAARQEDVRKMTTQLLQDGGGGREGKGREGVGGVLSSRRAT